MSPAISEFYQAERLLNDDVDTLQLMWADFTHTPDYHFYIKEVAQLYDGTLVVPMRWICELGDDGKIEKSRADVYSAEYNVSTGEIVIHITDKYQRIDCAELKHNYIDLINEHADWSIEGKL